MSELRKEWNEERMRQIMGRLLRVGVLVAAGIVLAGGILYFFQHAKEVMSYSTFKGEPERLRQVDSILTGALHLKSRAVIQLGLLLLIATPVARVLFSFAGFIVEKDWIYVFITFIVLVVLFFSLLSSYF